MVEFCAWKYDESNNRIFQILIVISIYHNQSKTFESWQFSRNLWFLESPQYFVTCHICVQLSNNPSISERSHRLVVQVLGLVIILWWEWQIKSPVGIFDISLKVMIMPVEAIIKKRVKCKVTISVNLKHSVLCLHPCTYHCLCQYVPKCL